MKPPHRRQFLHLAAGAAALPSVSRIARAQDRPSKPVRIIVGFTAGSATDITARLFAQKLNEAWKTPVTVENIPGAGGSVGAERVAKSAPDGSTLYWGANGAMTINPSLQPSPAFDPARDLAPIARVLVMSSILAVNNEVPAKSVAELFVLAKAQPGKLSFASPGAGTPQHIAGELLKSLAAVDIVHVPYRGGAQIVSDVIGNQLDLAVLVSISAVSQVQSKRLKAIAVTSDKRVASLPEVAAVAENPAFKGYNVVAWTGLFAPAQTPPAIVERLSRELDAVLRSDEVRDKLAEQGAVPGSGSPAGMLTVLNVTVASAAPIIRSNICGYDPWSSRFFGLTRPVSMIVTRGISDYLAIGCVAPQVPGRETSVSLLVMNSSSTGTPSLVF
jgi:tripartite-type tricarboxylate transporter receptor subunit TctC